jgi:UDP-N-acetylmuramoyl-L-alanyl-D-glutamate--2,6-diaminopimelate ligase
MINSPKNFDEILHELDQSGLRPQVLRAPQPGNDSFDRVVADSRKVKPRSVFCPISGQTANGHRYLPELYDRPVLAVVDEDITPPLDTCMAIIRTSSSRAAWAQLASFFCGHPQDKLCMIGVTGTNGKTSTVWMIHELLMAYGSPSASIGTLGFYKGRTHTESSHTTPDPDVLYPYLSELVTSGYSHVAMEVSSHSLVQGKLHPIQFDVTGFTSFSQDHLDFHATMSAYLQAKCLLFTKHLKSTGIAIFHDSLLMHDEVLTIKDALGSRAKIYGSDPSSQMRVMTTSDLAAGHLKLTVVSSPASRINIALPMIGGVFGHNFTCAALAAAHSVHQNPLYFFGSQTIKALQPVPGRLEPVRAATTPCRPTVYVDYAHTPDALEQSISQLSACSGRVFSVFGCGGDRDKSKRPRMGEIAARLSDVVFVTSDNPRSEDPALIISDILSGIPDKSSVHTYVDREKAIALAIKSARCHDVILVAGKGHETYQQVKDTKHPFSDQEVARIHLDRPLNWLVLGAGQSGLAAVKHLCARRQKVTLTDDRFINDVVLAEQLHGLAAAQALDVTVARTTQVEPESFDKIIISPGVSFDHPLAKQAKALGLEVLTEIDLGLNGFNGNILAATGTNGKSTTVAMVDFILNQLGLASAACGNIGIPPTTLDLETKGPAFTAVVELSSYQLEGCLSYPAKGVAITSFSNDHLERHKSMSAYFAAKWSLTSWLGHDGLLVISRDVADMFCSELDKGRYQWPQARTFIIDPTDRGALDLPSNVRVIRLSDNRAEFDGITIDFNNLHISGIHNQMNTLMAALLAQTVTPQTPIFDLVQLACRFKTLPFRCELIFDQGGVKIFNDSKSTNLESTLAAMSLARKPAILLMGGQGKGEPYHPLDSVKDKIKILMTFGASGKTIASQAPSDMAIQNFPAMADAVAAACQLAQELGCDIVFSPGCASFDAFRNFEHRGQIFNQLVQLHMKSNRGPMNHQDLE